ncbi:MAG: hypothetical protein OXC48_00320 [Endozoicomonadaceae bacterium]|nr:hypothetical protein [Endozoicomonadaceae bacterium]
MCFFAITDQQIEVKIRVLGSCIQLYKQEVIRSSLFQAMVPYKNDPATYNLVMPA